MAYLKVLITKKSGENKKMLKNTFKFPLGYVIIEVVGKNKERFLIMCLTHQFRIWEVQPQADGFVMKMASGDFLQIRPIVRKSGVSVKIISKHGTGRFIKKHRQRVAFPIAGLFVCVYFILVPRYIWCVEIDGARNADTDKIIEILKDKGVYIGASKKDIADLTEIKNAVVFGEERVNWAWLYIEGAKARLQIQEGDMPPAVKDKTTPTSIIASTDGFVRIAEVKRGERRVVTGDAVNKGDILVSGKVSVFREGDPEKYSYVNSDARIIADTIRTEEGIFTDKEILRIKTGNNKKRISIELFGKEYNPFGTGEDIFESYDIVTKNYDAALPIFGYLGFGIKLNTIEEINEYENTLTKNEVLSRAKEVLEERIMKNVGKEAEKTDEQLTYSENGGVYTVRLVMYFREDIGIKIPQEE